jgi:DNA-binding phage protein
MSSPGYDLRRLQRASQRLARATEATDTAREAYFAELRAARKASVSIAELARTVGVSRQRMQQLLTRLDK